ncbi:hypothetical protein JMJ77_0012751 [Colletotrichum scovillei]|uniref:Uncharacterized protein n=1 Tax=Colletotrichum scovillei TaxID=1209932 RepID=A0A9P7R5Q4_9PEZI|nr:hypothetical protein JMJ77_0012751 [Colletotrichum scovillei]KAG7069032.1 hypothetical protein JMJ76_0002710 [Colletotrichum scovillei]KAG7072986.1 hypothetical protein JMJ78_0013969 [Colletotrichum scovillei]
MAYAANSLAILYLLSLVNGSYALKSQVSYLKPRTDTAIQNSSSILTESLSNPNATGSWPIFGIDVSKPLSETPTNNEFGHGNGWSIDVAVATNVSGGIVSNSNPSKISLESSDNPVERGNATDGYRICSYVWWQMSWTENTIKKLNDDNQGSCGGVIPQNCIDDIRETAAKVQCDSSLESSLYGIGFDIPASCSDSMAYTTAERRNLTTEFISNASASSHTLFQSTAPYNIPGNDSNTRQVYDYAVTQVWPVMLSYSYTEGSAVSNYTVFRCVRANNITAGSRSPESFGNRPSSSTQHRSSFAGLFVGLLVATIVSSWM